MQNPFLYPGRGVLLREVAAATGNVPSNPSTTTIADGEYSETFSAHDCLEVMLEIVFDGAINGDVLIETLVDANASIDGDTFDTATAVATAVIHWNAGEALTGYFRIKNTSGDDCSVYLQKRIA